jgi:hypothetical protein
MRDQLTDPEKEIFAKVRAFGEAEILPIANDDRGRGKFPFELVPNFAALNSGWRLQPGRPEPGTPTRPTTSR